VAGDLDLNGINLLLPCRFQGNGYQGAFLFLFLSKAAKPVHGVKPPHKYLLSSETFILQGLPCALRVLQGCMAYMVWLHSKVQCKCIAHTNTNIHIGIDIDVDVDADIDRYILQLMMHVSSLKRSRRLSPRVPPTV
jgi:hypothetical protein